MEIMTRSFDRNLVCCSVVQNNQQSIPVSAGLHDLHQDRSFAGDGQRDE